jgi:hypothetical protein
MRWRPLPTALAFAAIGPLIGALLLLALFSPAIANLGPFSSDAFLDLLSGAYLVGLSPMAVTGYLVARAAGRRSRLPTLTLQASVLGFVLTGLAILVWILAGTAVESTAGVVIAVAAGGAISGFLTTLIVAGAVALLSRSRAAG